MMAQRVDQHQQKKALVYARVSDPKQVREGNSLDTQLARHQEYAEVEFKDGPIALIFQERQSDKAAKEAQ